MNHKTHHGCKGSNPTQWKHDGDQKLFLDEHMALVRNVAHQYEGRGLEFEDLAQEGAIALLKARQLYDPSQGAFRNFAARVIKNALIRVIQNRGRAIRLPCHIYEKLNRISREQQSLCQGLRRWPSQAELAEKIQMDAEDIDYLLSVSQSILSLNQPLMEKAEPEMIDCIGNGEKEYTPENYAEDMERWEEAQRLMNSVPEKYRTVVARRLGVGQAPQSVQAVRDQLHIGRETIRKRYNKAITMMQDHSRLTSAA